ncbi:IS66 Orf2 like protein [Thiothrix eikelboomii]|uniref:IS66 Orf2 like protein n=1 Tax=Thiothrix eikelboomii TaxID=92487 RepID=A0A1T4VSG7_9GAMM|nr:IS66 family insertion sequence element accessory protein TnpB [Thiothrix eikelboomii]SKA67906.1 IS66 Orf2 like protein [Thiothrix eikelboomii]
MFTPAATARLWLCTQATDMRKSFTGLTALVKNQLRQNPLSGHYFVFVNLRKTQMKILYFEPSGYCLWSQRLEQGIPGAADNNRAARIDPDGFAVNFGGY